MNDFEYYNQNIRDLGIDFYDFTERVSIMIIDGNLSQSDAQITALEGIRKEKLLKFKQNFIRSDGY